ncbi:hypothetical protein C5167_043612 [Papaver somniferum]|uniref:Serine hydrolase domain-containing protein n=1 Tax=Papaver somniferum TaxID=3469 RepID=A0A4Y7L9N7_PAPSO|nr:hypothetical protein C5167_043612 [Papaver somniferum]
MMRMIFPPPAIHILPLLHRNQLTITSHFGGEIDKSNKKMESQKRIEEDDERKPPRVLCLHGFRTSGEILKKQVLTKWPDSVVKKLDLVFIDAPFPSQGKSGVEGFYGPPYYERYQFEKKITKYRNFDECLEYDEDIMIKQGPFDGLLGFSQGGICSAGLPYLDHYMANELQFWMLSRIKKSSQYKEKGLKDADLLRRLFNRKFSLGADTDTSERTESNGTQSKD